MLMLVSETALGSPEDRYVFIYNLIQQADETKDANAAQAKYAEALTVLKAFQSEFPNWNVAVVNYRMKYLVSKTNQSATKSTPLTETATDTETKAANKPVPLPPLVSGRASSAEAGKGSAQNRSPALLEVLRNAKTATVEVEDLMINGHQTEDCWFRSSLRNELEKASVKFNWVTTNGDITFVFRASVTTVSADYVPRYAPQNAPAMRFATGSTVKGTLRIESHRKVLTTIPFTGSCGAAPTVSLGGGYNPIEVAVRDSRLYNKVLSILWKARENNPWWNR
ncbi:MAG: hypothetical protein NT105_12450 [Verrucomicrobia bacterium]|nr:hypothetical protein [Verrucomicrobiota bacterium]